MFQINTGGQKMDAFKSDIYSYLGGNCHYIIPLYQRAYSWKKENCIRLWNDIVRLHKENREGHFVGSIVRIDESAPAGTTIAMIIDGQQRLTTLTILLIALREYAVKHPECGVNPDEIKNTLLINQYKSGDLQYKLLLTQTDREVLLKMVDGAKIAENTKSKVLENYDFFATQIAKEQISAFDLYATIGKLQIVDIKLDRRYDDPQAIFESLNSTGMDLKDSDLIRNHLLMGLDSNTQAQVYKNSWRPTEKLFDYDHRSEILDNFFRDYLTMKLARIPRKDEVYKEFIDYHVKSNMSISELCDDIYSCAKHYSDMYFARSQYASLASLYKDMKAIRMEVAYPFLLIVHDDHEKGIVGRDELEQIVSLCVSYILRRAICEMPTNSLNKTFATMKGNIRKDDYLNSIKAAFVLLESYKVFPDDERFSTMFTTRDIYHLSRCGYILTRLENWNNKAVVSLDNLTIEHIMPQNPNLSESWVQALGPNRKEIQAKYLHTIGNLTLTAYNTQMSDSSFDKKLNMDGGFKQSALKLNAYVVTQDTWSETQIQNRANMLSDIARKVWPYPLMTDEEIESYKKKDIVDPEYTIENYQWTEENRVLFERLDARIKNLGAFVKRECKKLYIAYKADTNFVDIVLQKSRLRLSVNMKFADVVDTRGICKDVSNLGRWGNGEVEVFLEHFDDIDAVMEIVEQGLRVQDIE